MGSSTKACFAAAILLCFLLSLFIQVTQAELLVARDDLGSGACSDSAPCTSGCCGRNSTCGFGVEFCGDGCQSNCDAKAECGRFSIDGKSDCPLNSCCRFVRNIK
jgi:hypothetical protein